MQIAKLVLQEARRILASRGGVARAKKLSPRRRRQIAAMGGRASKGRPRRRRKILQLTP